jgi:predicted RNA binding protein YcfA (HicA-like mRNA interferase family)
VTWGELIRRLQAAGFVEQRRGKGSPRQFVHPDNGRVITVSVYTKKEVGAGLARRMLKRCDYDAVLPHHCRAGEQRHR